jgi:hypothetical protein
MSENSRYSFYEVVPDDYDLLGAPSDQLDRYGIPQKPDADAEPSLFEFWKRLVSRPFSAKQPTFSSTYPPSRTELRSFTLHSSRRGSMREAGVVPSRGTLESSLNWSGALISPPSTKRIVLASAGWIAPNVRTPKAKARFRHSDDSKSLVWVGIDGHNGRLPTISLPQIGTAHWPGGQPQHFAWWDWWRKSSPEDAITEPIKAITKIDHFPINAGDEVLAGLVVMPSEDIQFFIKNQSTGEFRSFLAKPLPNIEPTGSSVEWVVERPTHPTSGKFHLLADYGSVDFKYCMALAADRPLAPGRLMTLADNGRMIKMREAFEKPYRTFYVSRAKRRRDPGGSIGVTCTFNEP